MSPLFYCHKILNFNPVALLMLIKNTLQHAEMDNLVMTLSASLIKEYLSSHKMTKTLAAFQSENTVSHVSQRFNVSLAEKSLLENYPSLSK
jgi:hypothetical protein